MHSLNLKPENIHEILKKISELPVVADLIHEEDEKTTEAHKQARLACLNRLKSLYAKEVDTRKKVDEKIAVLRAAEDKLAALRTEVAIASNTHTAAASTRQTAEQELQTIHGEAHVTRALFALDRLQKTCAEKLADIEHTKFLKHTLGGVVYTRGINPEYEIKRSQLITQAGLIEQALADVRALIWVDIAPSRLEKMVTGLLHSVGLKSSFAQVPQ